MPIEITGDASISFTSADGKHKFTIHGENQDCKNYKGEMPDYPRCDCSTQGKCTKHGVAPDISSLLK